MENGTKAPIENRIFTNRNLKLKGIKAVGFDMDYTIAKYRSPEIEKLTFKKSIEKLVYEKHYPKELLDFEYRDNFAIRGLIFDIKHGNILKTNKFRYVKRFYHGFQKYSKKERKKLYTNKKLDLSLTWSFGIVCLKACSCVTCRDSLEKDYFLHSNLMPWINKF